MFFIVKFINLFIRGMEENKIRDMFFRVIYFIVKINRIYIICKKNIKVVIKIMVIMVFRNKLEWVIEKVIFVNDFIIC